MKNAFEFKTLAEFLEHFHDEKTCVAEFTEMRFRNGKKDFTIRTNPVFGESKLPLRKWFIAIYLLSTSKGISSVQLGK